MYPFRERRGRLRALQGGLLGLGAPLGWLAIRLLLGSSPDQEFGQDAALYAYMLVGTLTAFSLFGWVIGRQEDRLRRESVTDALTGLHNVRSFRQRFAEELLLSGRRKRPISLLILDLDHFKKVNDRHGHPAGDKVLTAFAQILASHVRSGDLAARVGGEEFAVMLPGTPAATARKLAQRIRRAVEKRDFAVSERLAIRTSVSVGLVSSVPLSGARHESFYSAADKALYRAKTRGRNRVEEGSLGPL